MPERIDGTLMTDPNQIRTKPFRILSLDGGGAKGFYSLGVLSEIEGMVGKPLHEAFDLVFGTSTGAIITALIALGYSIADIHKLYCDHVPEIMKKKCASDKSKALKELADKVFEKKLFDDVKTRIGIVATKWLMERPMIFKGDIAQAHGRTGTFKPGFGVTIADAVQASCSAYPYFERKTVTTGAGDIVELIDGGFCANNPTLYAIADATHGLKVPPEQLRVVSVGVGTYPQRKLSMLTVDYWKNKTPGVQLLQKTLEINTQSMDQLCQILFKHVDTIRISDSFSTPEMATDLFEHDLGKLNILRQRGVASFASCEIKLKKLMTS
jgi:patatin-like phospholipase/acyl hydrolase